MSYSRKEDQPGKIWYSEKLCWNVMSYCSSSNGISSYGVTNARNYHSHPTLKPPQNSSLMLMFLESSATASE
jgi:hypothetical protein